MLQGNLPSAAPMHASAQNMFNGLLYLPLMPTALSYASPVHQEQLALDSSIAVWRFVDTFR